MPLRVWVRPLLTLLTFNLSHSPPSPLYRLGRQDSFSLLYDTRGADLLFKKTKGKKMFVENPSVPFGRLLVSIR